MCCLHGHCEIPTTVGLTEKFERGLLETCALI